MSYTKIESAYQLTCDECDFKQEVSRMDVAVDAAESHIMEHNDDDGYLNQSHRVSITRVDVVSFDKW